jgi:serine/threonine protein kinase
MNPSPSQPPKGPGEPIASELTETTAGETRPGPEESQAGHDSGPWHQVTKSTGVPIPPPQPTMDFPGRISTLSRLPRSFGGYELLAEVARGGMGVIFKARHKALDRIVALKMILGGQLLSSTSIERFHREARAAAALDHPGIVTVHEVGEIEGQHYLTMTFIDGCSLSAHVRDGLLPAQMTAALMRDVARAVAYAHSRGVVHRDLKPENILIDRSGRPRVTDFGLAKRAEDDSQLTNAGDVVGTPSYMAPEQARGQIDRINALTDVYSLGAVLYFLLTGKPPFRGQNLHEVICNVVSGELTPPTQVNPQASPELTAICLKCLNKEPVARYPSAEALADALADVAGSEPSAPKVSTPVEVPRPALVRWRRALIWCVVGVAVVGLAGLVYWFWPTIRSHVPGAQVGNPIEDIADYSDLVPKHKDFDLKVMMVGDASAADGVIRLRLGDPVTFEITPEQTCFIGIWALNENGVVEQLFPNEWDEDNKVQAGQTRRVPSAKVEQDKRIYAGPVSRKPERIWIVASEKKGTDFTGRSKDEFLQFLSSMRDLRIRGARVGRSGLSEVAVSYQVLPKAP